MFVDTTLAIQRMHAVYLLYIIIIGAKEMDSEEQSQRRVSEETTVEPRERLDALEEKAARVQQSVAEMEERHQIMERQRDEARATLEKALLELQRVKGELQKVCCEVKGFHTREYAKFEETKKLKESNRQLEDEVVRLDKVALGLENELSAAELALERREQGEESVKALETELAIALSDVHSKEWRIDDLVSQVGDLKESLLEYQGKIMDLERRNEHLARSLEESEASYQSAKYSSVASLQRMDTRLSELRYIVSKEGSNATLEHVLTRDDALKSRGADVYSTTPDTPESRLAGFSEAIPLGDLSREGSTFVDLEVRLSELEQEYSGTRILCEELKRENTALKAREVELKKENLRSIELALERIEEESKEKTDALLNKQKNELTEGHNKALEQISKEKQSLENALRDMVEKTTKHEKASQAALDAARAHAEEGKKENRKLVKEKDALCGVIEELKQALSLAEERLVYQNSTDKENPLDACFRSPQKSMQVSPGIPRGTPLQSLAVNVLRE